MLQYQRGEYCICIWDGEYTKLSRALESLGKYTENEKAMQDHQGFTVTAWMFDQGTVDDKVKKMLEKEIGVIGALQYEGREAKNTLYGLANVVTACLSLVKALGYSAEEFQEQLNMVKESNARKGCNPTEGCA